MDKGRYYKISDYYKKTFGKKVYKLALDIGATCPNRDGSISIGGCIFCSGAGSGDFASVDMQLDKAIALLGNKASGAYIAYFQSFTNTYMDVSSLDGYVQSALNYDGVVGLAISTRPDCIDEEMYGYLYKLNSRTHLVIELGMQTAKDETLRLINRGHSFETFRQCYDKLRGMGIKVCVHIMNGLPGETMDDMMNNAEILADMHPFSVKIHNTYVVRGTVLDDMYERGEYRPLEMVEYTEILAAQLAVLPQDICIERVTGDGSRMSLVAPMWTLHKRYFLNSLDAYMRERGISQGCNIR